MAEGNQQQQQQNNQGGQDPYERVKKLEQKLSKQGQTIQEQQDTIDAATKMANIVAYNPELKKHFIKVRDGQTGSMATQTPSEQQQEVQEKENTSQTPPQSDPRVAKDINEVKVAQRESIIKSFEQRHGINSLDEDEKKQIRQKIEKTLNDFGTSVNSSPLDSLDKQLESAYISSHADKLREEGKLEGYAEYRQNQQGAIGGLKGGKEDVEDEGTLSPGQMDWAKKLGVDVTKAQETYQNREKEAETDPVEARKEE